MKVRETILAIIVVFLVSFHFHSVASAAGLGGPPGSVWEMIFGKLKPAPSQKPGRDLSQRHRNYNPRSYWGGRLGHPLQPRNDTPNCPPEEPGCTR